MNSIRAIFFDGVGTLLHPEPAAAQVYAEAARRFGSQYDRASIAQRFARAFQKQEASDRDHGWVTCETRELVRWRAIVGDVLDDARDPAGCFDFVYGHFAKPESWRCEPGVEAVCADLQARGYQLGLASNFDARLYGLVHGLRPLRYLVKNVVVSFEVGFRKPAPAFFHAMCRTAGMGAAQILHIGDDPDNDYAGAEAVGMAAVLFVPREEYEHWAGARIRTLGEVTVLLERV